MNYVCVYIERIVVSIIDYNYHCSEIDISIMIQRWKMSGILLNEVSFNIILFYPIKHILCCVS